MNRAVVTKKFEFSAAHAISTHPGMCRFLHGHNFEVTISVFGPFDPYQEVPMVLEFKVLKGMVNQIIGDWDHGTLLSETQRDSVSSVVNFDLFGNVHFFPFEPTAENLALYIKTKLYKMIQEDPELSQVGVRKVVVRETDRSSVYVSV